MKSPDVNCENSESEQGQAKEVSAELQPQATLLRQTVPGKPWMQTRQLAMEKGEAGNPYLPVCRV